MNHKMIKTIDSCEPEAQALAQEYMEICSRMMTKYPSSFSEMHFVTQDFNRDGAPIQGVATIEVLVIDHRQVAILSKVRCKMNWVITTLIDLSEETDAVMQKRDNRGACDL